MKVYFNNSCKICRSEINLYKKENIQEIDWIDITNNSAAEKETYKKDKDLLRRLHVKDGKKIISGAEAFLYVWKKIPKYKFLYNFFKLPVIFQIQKISNNFVSKFKKCKNYWKFKKIIQKFIFWDFFPNIKESFCSTNYFFSILNMQSS